MHAFQLAPGFPGLQHGGWGLGMRVVGDDDPSLPKGSYGWSGAFWTHFFVDPKDHLVAIQMLNSAAMPGTASEPSAAVEFEKQVAGLVIAGCGTRSKP
jgi:CubicO group peptidase (beta-lactamase class C family)